MIETLSSFIYKTPVVGSTFAFEGFNISNKNIMVEASIEPKDFALKIYKAYINAGNIYEEEWNELIANLEKRFSYKSFSKIIKADIDNLKIFS